MTIADQIKNLLGGELVRLGVARLFALLQEPALNRRLALVAFEALLEAFFTQQPHYRSSQKSTSSNGSSASVAEPVSSTASVSVSSRANSHRLGERESSYDERDAPHSATHVSRTAAGELDHQASSSRSRLAAAFAQIHAECHHSRKTPCPLHTIARN